VQKPKVKVKNALVTCYHRSGAAAVALPDDSSSILFLLEHLKNIHVS